ncbi:MAG: RnfABCDGE type electron transport complex subunit B [Clostridia bacterium]|nr:RnfABCDGE type electron transport complex subunit B [Clostridia bacterium]
MSGIITAVLTVGIIGLVFGLLLAFAAVIFRVDVDERVEKIEEVLPGANCGACGYAGCSAYAHAVVEQKAPVDCCSVGKGNVAMQIGGIMGKAVAQQVPKIARVLCGGSCEKAKNKYEYYGVEDCGAANKLAGGQKACPTGCLGYGTCVSVCKFDAIHVENGIAVVDEEKCTACGMCVKACPKKLIELVPKDKTVSVLCKNRQTGKEVNASCSAGCIACKICEKNCPLEAIAVNGNLAEIDYEKCKSCGICANKCPKQVIINKR